jgi:hypothetical protein
MKLDITTIDTALDEFAEMDEPIIDLTEPKTFVAACAIAILCGVMIGIGYYMVFNWVDCTPVVAQRQICFPNEYGNHKLVVMIVTMIAGILTGASPAIYKFIRNYDWE